MDRRLKSLLLHIASYLDPTYIGLYKITTGYHGPIPPLMNRRRVGNIGIGSFLSAGRNCYLSIKQTIVANVQKPLPKLRILDFGAGPGRTLQFFYAESPTIYATDIDPTSVRYLHKAFPLAHVQRNENDPPLDYSDDFFDVIYSVSVWTHLPLDRQQPWLEEMRRILKPGGLALITTSGFAGLRSRQQRDHKWSNVTGDELLQKGIIYKEYPHFIPDHPQNFPGIDGSYGLTAHSPVYIKKVWGELYTVMEIHEQVIDYIQDLVILKKSNESQGV